MSKQHSKRKRTIKKSRNVPGTFLIGPDANSEIRGVNQNTKSTLKMKSIKLPKIGMRVSHLTEDKKSGPCRMVESYNTVKPW